MQNFFIDIQVAEHINSGVMAFVQSHGDGFHAVTKWLLTYFLVPLEKGLMALPPPLVLVVVGLLSWHASRRWRMALFLTLSLYLIGCVGLWDKLMQTVALMLVSTLLTLLLGLPLGIWRPPAPGCAARSPRCWT